MHFANIKFNDIANGPGVRTSLFVSGCTRHCPGCFNEIAWDFQYGTPFTRAVEDAIIESCEPFYIKGITLLGGEPMEPENQVGLLPFLKRFREAMPGKDIWCYSGYTWEELTGQAPARCRTEVTDDLLHLMDVLVDGSFIEAEHDVALRFRGSANQRILDMHESMKQGKPVWWADDPAFASHTKLNQRNHGR